MEPVAASTGLFDTMGTPRRPEILQCKFNQTGTSILATTAAGFMIYVLDKEGNVQMQHEYDVGTEIKFAERLYSTNLVAYATRQNPDVFVVFHCKRRKIVCDFRYPSDINIIRFNRQRVIIAIKDVVYIHNVRNMQIVHLIKDVPENSRNIMELACAENCGYLAFPWKSDTGSIRVFDVFNLQDVACIQAHQSPLALIKFDPTGCRIATASVKGTCIRVFDTTHGKKLYEFRRGFKEVRINSLSFSLDSRFLSATSDSETIHIFKLLPEKEIGAISEDSGFLTSVKDTFATAGGLLTFEERAVVTFPSPLHGQTPSGFLGSLAPAAMNFMLTSPTGLLHIFALSDAAQGDLFLRPLKQYNLRDVKKSITEVALLDQEPDSPMGREDEPVVTPASTSNKPFDMKKSQRNESPAAKMPQ